MSPRCNKPSRVLLLNIKIVRQLTLISRPSEAVRPVRPWPDQNFPHSIQNKSYVVKKFETINTIVLIE